MRFGIENIWMFAISLFQVFPPLARGSGMLFRAVSRSAFC